MLHLPPLHDFSTTVHNGNAKVPPRSCGGRAVHSGGIRSPRRAKSPQACPAVTVGDAGPAPTSCPAERRSP